MTSKTRMLELVSAFDWRGMAAALQESPGLIDWRGDKGRNWLHQLCGVPLTPARNAADSVRAAKLLQSLGFGLSVAAWREGNWCATPVWFAIGRGRNLVLAKWLLQAGANPNYTLWAASFVEDIAAIRLLIKHGAIVDDPAVPFETPFLGAIGNSKFVAAAELLRHGADVNATDSKGRTALHLMLKKGSEAEHFGPLIKAGALGDIADDSGLTAREIMLRKKDPIIHHLAAQLGSAL